MQKISWWQGEYAGRWKINEAVDQLNAIDGVTEGLAEQIGRLFRMDAEQGKEISRLHVVLQVLIQQLVQSGVLDETDLSMRVEAAIDQLENPEPPPGAEGQAAVAGRTIQCAVCQREIPESQAYFTEMGQACPTCYQNLS